MNDYEKRHLATLRSHLAECTVLLRQNGDFPLDAAGEIAAYGSGVRNTVKGGTGSGEVNSRYSVNVEQGLKNAGFTVTTDAWLDAYEATRVRAKAEFVARIKAEAKAAHQHAAIYCMGKIMPEPDYELPLDGAGDTAIYVLSRISGEGSDRAPTAGDIKPSATETRDILALNRQYKRFMLVLNVGGPVDLSAFDEVGNILLLSQLGVETGDALADILLGRANPSGKLTTTWSAWEDYAPMPDFGDHNDTHYNEGIYVGYRYFDTIGRRAMFPFGYGCSYTGFSTEVKSVAVDGSVVTVEALVTNTGGFAGKEVVQVYVSPPQGRLDKPYQTLAGFAKTSELAPNESETVSVSFGFADLASYDTERSAFLLEKGSYIVRVGNSSADTVAAAVLTLDTEVVTEQLRRSLGECGFEDWRPEEREAVTIPDDVPTIAVDAAAIPTVTANYDTGDEIDEFIRTLSDEQLVYANIGANPGGSLSVIGNASANVAGAAGESTSKMKELGFPNMIMADGPAGLRISQQFYRDKKGAHSVGQDTIPETIVEFLPAPIRMMMGGGGKVKKGVTVEYQYTTALPIGTAIAQSWNLDFAYACGDIVGDEMERFGVHLWLAPALNIHRSIRCGRNFEYYSEDPLISGKFAAAVTRGVQSHRGRGVTLKHYAANNQETNRYGSNSHVSERAMREIYLKGFGICIREAQPHAVMTSYNLLNGVHTAESRELCVDILRREFGFEGIVMTDWIVGDGVMNSKEDIHPPVKPPRVAAAGGDLYMPGGKKDIKNMRAGLRGGTVTREQLMINATRVYRMAKRLAVDRT